MRLIIAEKPSLGRAIADVLPKPHKKAEGHIIAANGDVVTWCVGHLLEQLAPDAYDEKYKTWRMEHLPIVPQKWQLKPRKGVSKQLNVIKGLIKKADVLVNAGDPDREGQLLVDEVIDYLNYPTNKRDQIQRLLISDLNPAAVKKALNQLRSNQDFIPLSVSALARARADWLYGMNMSRAYTLLGQKGGYKGVLSVGRVQTPILGLVVRRDEEIENFIPKPYYQLHALIPHDGKDIRAKWLPSKACEPYQDEEGRVLVRPLVENVASRIAGKPAKVVKSEQKTTKQAPPLPYSLSALQIDAAKRYGISAANTLQACQNLYEKHKLITYPRSDCRYLPTEHFKEASFVVAAIENNEPGLLMDKARQEFNIAHKSKVWNDAKVEAHHAIIPTPKKLRSASLGASEQKIYALIAKQYLYQFYAAAEYAESTLLFEIEGGKFQAKGRSLVKASWKVLDSKNGQGEETQNRATQGKDENSAYVPPLKQGEVLICREGEIKDRMTEPPRHFTDASLLRAMTGISRFVTDKSLKKVLRETDGLGTEATRASILELLFKRGLLEKQGKQIRATQAGRALVHTLPQEASLPDMTAHWEHQLQQMAERKYAYQPFMQALQDRLQHLVEDVRVAGVPAAIAELKNVPVKKRGGRRKYKRKSRPRT